MTVDLSDYSPGEFDRGAGKVKEGLWIITSLLLFRLCPFVLSPLKRGILRIFGAKIGHGVVIKPQVKITFPWKLTIGDHVWLGEECWILNLEKIEIGDNVCISQRAFLCTGNHNFSTPSFDLMVKPILVEEGAWIGAGSFVGPGVNVGSHAVLTAGSVTGKSLGPWTIYQGDPAVAIKERVITSGSRAKLATL